MSQAELEQFLIARGWKVTRGEWARLPQADRDEWRKPGFRCSSLVLAAAVEAGFKTFPLSKPLIARMLEVV